MGEPTVDTKPLWRVMALAIQMEIADAYQADVPLVRLIDTAKTEVRSAFRNRDRAPAGRGESARWLARRAKAAARGFWPSASVDDHKRWWDAYRERHKRWDALYAQHIAPKGSPDATGSA